MNVYVIEPLYDQFTSYVPVDSHIASSQYSSLRCKGEPLNWPSPLPIKVEEEDLGMPEADIGFINIGSLVLSEAANKALADISASCGELLPLTLADRRLWLWNVTTVVDALDKAESVFNSHGGVTAPVFSRAALANVQVFKIREDNFSNIYCTDAVARLIEQHQLSGIELSELPLS